MVFDAQVYLIGAGTGNPEDLTLRAQRLLQSAEVVVYDALIPAPILALVPPHCLKVHVGKRGGKPSTPQGEINQLLVKYCLQGKQVVRLKSGDPLIFGRSRSEMEALQNAGCSFELVSGLSSALAAPLRAKIPLTDKILSHYFTVLSAHQPDLLDWETLAKIDTLVILMGGRNLGKIVQLLQRHGRSSGHPIAIIRHAGQPQEQIWWGTLENIEGKTEGISLSPAVIVIGEVVQLATDNWQFKGNVTSSPSLPLTGKTILVTRAVEQSSTFSQLLSVQGATVVEMAALEITPPSSWQDLDQAIANLATFNWLILTSSNGVDYFFERLLFLGQDVRALGKLKIAVVGRKTAASLQKRGLNPDFIPPNFVADSLVENFPEPLANQQVLFPRVETGGRTILVKELVAQNAKVAEVAAYQSQCPQQIPYQAFTVLQQQSVDIITFASSKTVKNFLHLLKQSSNSPIDLIQTTKIASIGPQTSKTCHQLLGKVDIEAEEYTLEGLTKAIIKDSLGCG